MVVDIEWVVKLRNGLCPLRYGLCGDVIVGGGRLLSLHLDAIVVRVENLLKVLQARYDPIYELIKHYKKRKFNT